MQKSLREGITTGTCAAAAAKAALLTLLSRPIKTIGITAPQGRCLEIVVKRCEKLSDDTALASVVKDAGDDKPFDVTHGLEIFATVRTTDDGKVAIKGGKGVGVVTKPGLPVPVGEPAINSVPRRMIVDAIKEVLPPDQGAEVVVSVPRGEEVAKKTLNPKLGIIGGISIIGTTGIVKPRSVEACKRSLESQINVAAAQGHKIIVLVPGNIGEKIATQLLSVPNDAIVQTGDLVGYALEKVVEKGMEEIVILGHPGKLVKVAAGIFNTHHRVADARMEVIAAYAGAVGADKELIRTILKSNTTEEVLELLRRENLLKRTFTEIARQIRSRSMERIKDKAQVGAILASLDGAVLGMDDYARCLEIW